MWVDSFHSAWPLLHAIEMALAVILWPHALIPTEIPAGNGNWSPIEKGGISRGHSLHLNAYSWIGTR